MFAYAVWFANSALSQGPPSSASTLETEVKEIRTENGVLREQVRQLKEQQDTLVGLVGQLQRRLDGQPNVVAHEAPPAAQPVPVLPVTTVA
jgi:hypothetical protein